MDRNMKKYPSIIVLILAIVFTATLTAQSSVSSDIHIKAGEKTKRSVSSVSGDIFIGKNARVLAGIGSVSGDIEVGAKARIGNIESVSGDISIGKGAQTGSIETVSGDLELYGQNDIEGSVNTVSGDVNSAAGTDIHENLTTVSGDIDLDDSRLRGNIETVSGDISLFNGSMVEGDIIIDRKYRTAFSKMGTLKVVIDLNSVVKGSIKVKEADTNVFVYLLNGGKVNGEIINAEVREK